ncbi:MAG: acyl carrier protein [Colwellia sp.]
MTDNREVKSKVLALLTTILIEDFEIEAEDISLDAHLYDDLDLDSIDAVDLAVKLREETGKKIEPDDFKKVRTVDDVVVALAKLLD